MLFFFIELGAQFDFTAVGEQIPQAVVLSLFVLVGNPLIVLVLMGVMRYPKRVTFLAGLAVAQISEFSLILIALGYSLGHVGREAVGLVTLVGLVTIGASTYLIIYSHQIYERIAPMLRVFERRNLIRQRARPQAPVDVIIYGYGRFGREIAHGLAAEGQEVLVVEWDSYSRPAPDMADRVRIVYGDADDHEFPGSLPLDSARWAVSTIPHLGTSRTLARSLERWGYQGKVAVTAHSSSARKQLARDVEEGRIDRVLNPFKDAGQTTVRGLLPAA